MFGGSESRFVLGHLGKEIKYDTMPANNKYLEVKNSSYGTIASLGNRDLDNRYQKFRIQNTKSGSYIRFDNHPQPGLRVKDDDKVVYLLKGT